MNAFISISIILIIIIIISVFCYLYFLKNKEENNKQIEDIDDEIEKMLKNNN